MTGVEFSNGFDVLFNNITSNQAPGLNEYEKSLFLTKAQDELLKNYFNPKGNKYQEGFDGNPKRQMDFSLLMRTHGAAPVTYSSSTSDYDPSSVSTAPYDTRGKLYTMPDDVFIPINESLRFVIKNTTATPATYSVEFSRQVIPLSFDEYTKLMNKPYKEPLKNQAWRLLVDNTINSAYLDGNNNHVEGKLTEIIAGHNDLKWLTSTPETGTSRIMQYILRYIRKPKPILVAPIDSSGVTINGHDGHWTSSSDYDTAYEYNSSHTEILNPCELDESLHEEILQRAVELAKMSWTATGQDNTQVFVQAGQRSE